MTEAVKILSLINMIFVAFLMLSGYVGGIFGEAVYYLAFLVPIAIGFYYSDELKRKREEVAGIAEEPDGLLDFDTDRAKGILPLIAPTVAIVFATSFLTSLFLSLFGVGTVPVENSSIIRMLLVHALAPAFFEEALFRYIPLKLLLPYSKRRCVIYSALYFALIHCSFSQMPYAFVAGVLFMMIDIAFGSVWPSVILHFVNNAASVVWIKYGHGTLGVSLFVGILFALVLLSLLFIYRKRAKYASLLRSSFEKGESEMLTYAPLVLALICCYMAAINLFS